MIKNKFCVLVLDGQGGGLGARLVKLLKPVITVGCELLCVGTNVLATNAMLKAGAGQVATGENAVIYNAGRADLILGPVGIVQANGILGEVSPAMAVAVSGSDAVKIIIPSSNCDIYVAGTESCRLDEYLRRAVEMVQQQLAAAGQ